MKVGRNDPCPCGSGKKYKQCHMKEDLEGKAAKYTPSGKRKFTAKVLKVGGESLSVFGRAATAPQAQPEADKMEKLKFKMTNRDFQKKVEDTEESFPLEAPSEESHSPSEGKVQRLGETFQATKQDFREKKDEE